MTFTILSKTLRSGWNTDKQGSVNYHFFVIRYTKYHNALKIFYCYNYRWFIKPYIVVCVLALLCFFSPSFLYFFNKSWGKNQSEHDSFAMEAHSPNTNCVFGDMQIRHVKRPLIKFASSFQGFKRHTSNICFREPPLQPKNCPRSFSSFKLRKIQSTIKQIVI